MIRIKICGITNLEDAIKAIELGADALGFIFYKKSPRCIHKDTAKEIIRYLPPFVAKVGVFVDEKEDVVREIHSYCGLTALQFHGNESGEYCAQFCNVIKAFRIKDKSSLLQVKRYEPYINAILFDTYKKDIAGGTGDVFDWSVLSGFSFEKPIVLSGGMNIDNARSAIETVRPYAVDCSSGIESAPGRKDHDKMKKFIEITKRDYL
ncbi:MAG: phosphoribosylanthranilate isomerase [Candidatus Nanohalarchaeota archaeon]|nr:MAG: phosphoribosylanthranilate isomerase [Candidatus Nanohaloarchaeota archaeon]